MFHGKEHDTGPPSSKIIKASLKNDIFKHTEHEICTEPICWSGDNLTNYQSAHSTDEGKEGIIMDRGREIVACVSKRLEIAAKMSGGNLSKENLKSMVLATSLLFQFVAERSQWYTQTALKPSFKLAKQLSKIQIHEIGANLGLITNTLTQTREMFNPTNSLKVSDSIKERILQNVYIMLNDLVDTFDSLAGYFSKNEEFFWLYENTFIRQDMVYFYKGLDSIEDNYFDGGIVMKIRNKAESLLKSLSRRQGLDNT